ncbi:hypothetical protein B0H17DRAFT_1211642 [Mycena rosella]|uniref:Uncharacterized protein n=1 Tax=Mycena rosella TaxID=1033263 RepID=A0AAD7CUN5_MYCRO|nr:hypothetical protein B0H17DRAFT_1211642 [Mycena rosella]
MASPPRASQAPNPRSRVLEEFPNGHLTPPAMQRAVVERRVPQICWCCQVYKGSHVVYWPSLPTYQLTLCCLLHLIAFAVLENPRLIPKSKFIVFEIATNVNENDSTFEIHATQYLFATKTANNVFPVRCLFPDTKCWEKYEPLLAKGTGTSVEGFLTGVERNEDCTVKYFIVDLEKVTFLDQNSVVPVTKEINTGTPACLKFTGFFGSPGSDTKSEEPCNKKHKTADDHAHEEAEDKGEGTSSGRCATRQ